LTQKASEGALRVVSDLEFPDIVGQQLASPYFSIVLQNTLTDKPVEQITVSIAQKGVQVTQQEYPTLFPGQTSIFFTRKN
jgi:LytS/YehU family sensor histidine kinase